MKRERIQQQLLAAANVRSGGLLIWLLQLCPPQPGEAP